MGKHSFILIPYIFLSITQGCSSQSQRDSMRALNLGQYRWSKRVIITYSQSEEDPELAKLKTPRELATTTTGIWSTCMSTQERLGTISRLSSLVTTVISSTRHTRVPYKQSSISSIKCP